jgi:hypothetical protein
VGKDHAPARLRQIFRIGIDKLLLLRTVAEFVEMLARRRIGFAALRDGGKLSVSGARQVLVASIPLKTRGSSALIGGVLLPWIAQAAARRRLWMRFRS